MSTASFNIVRSQVKGEWAYEPSIYLFEINCGVLQLWTLLPLLWLEYQSYTEKSYYILFAFVLHLKRKPSSPSNQLYACICRSFILLDYRKKLISFYTKIFTLIWCSLLCHIHHFNAGYLPPAVHHELLKV